MPGDEDVIVDLSRLDGLADQLTAAGVRQMRVNALDLLSEAVVNAPVEEGTLRGSGSAHLEGRRIGVGPKPTDPNAEAPTPAAGGADTGKAEAAVAFNSVYAAEQHERTDFAHPKGGKAKYLEDALSENSDLYLRAIADAQAAELAGRQAASAAARSRRRDARGRFIRE